MIFYLPNRISIMPVDFFCDKGYTALFPMYQYLDSIPVWVLSVVFLALPFVFIALGMETGCKLSQKPAKI